MFSLISLDGKTWGPLIAFGLLGVFAWWIARQIMRQNQADQSAAYDAANTYGGGPAVSADANTALLQALFAGGANQTGLPAPGTQATYSSPGQSAPLSAPGSLPVSLGNSSNTNGL